MTTATADKKYPRYESSQQWLEKTKLHYPNLNYDLLSKACEFAETTPQPKATPYASSAFNEGLLMADTLLELNCDSNTVAAAIVYPTVHYNQPAAELVSAKLGALVHKLAIGVEKMEAIHSMRSRTSTHAPAQNQIDNLRKMLLAMVDDIRVVLIKLAEQLAILKYLRQCTPIQQTQIAQQTMDLYAPLANRLGIGQLKWQLEDFAFRYLAPERYSEISASLNMRRDDREAFVKSIITQLTQLLNDAQIKHVAISGRAKHIYSIYRKTQHKNVNVDEVYDISAVRILVPSVQDCYAVLSIVHAQWPHITKEFDDYIAKPKANGYRSIHTVVIGPNNINTEVQIRTHEMHQESELGIAAHWKYKEGGKSEVEYADKIAWLREVMNWQKEVSSEDPASNNLFNKVFEDCIYVFTPQGDIFDMPAKSTPLDFAYRVHSDVGHRCRGAKVNDHLVPLTHALHTGDRVEILTAKNHAPSRDWLNPHAGYITTNQARTKIRHWFKKQDYDDNLAQGHELWDKGTHRSGFSKNDLNKILDRFSMKKIDDLLAALGAGDISLSTILNQLKALEEKQTPPPPTQTTATIKSAPPARKSESRSMLVQGIDDLLTQMARCCKPIPGDPIMGYITKGRGVTIHHRNCRNIQQAVNYRPERVIEVDWGGTKSSHYPVDITIEAFDRAGLIRDITTLIANEHLSVLGLTTRVDKMDNIAYIDLTIEIKSLEPLSKILAQLKQIEGVVKAQRR